MPNTGSESELELLKKRIDFLETALRKELPVETQLFLLDWRKEISKAYAAAADDTKIIELVEHMVIGPLRTQMAGFRFVCGKFRERRNELIENQSRLVHYITDLQRSVRALIADIRSKPNDTRYLKAISETEKVFSRPIELYSNGEENKIEAEE